jgi:pyruvate,orthophosphate dikinase
VDLDEKDLKKLVKEFKKIIKKEHGSEFPQHPEDQLRLCIEAVFKSWDNKRARDYRRRNKIPDDLGTAVNIQTMVFGNKGDDSGTGVAFTRNPATGENLPYGDYLANAQGEDVVAGIRNTLPLHDMGKVQPEAWAELQKHMKTLEQHFKDMCDIEFTVEQGKLWLLQTRVGKRTARAEWEIAFDMVLEELIDDETAVRDRLDANRLDELFKPRIETRHKEAENPIAKGLNASPGAAVGRVVFSADDSQAMAEKEEKVILVRRETTPDDYHGMVVAQGILTSAGGTNSHAAVVARGEGIPAVCGADALSIDRRAKEIRVDGLAIKEGDWITIDGTDGSVYPKELSLEPSELEIAMKGDESGRRTKLWKAYSRFMGLADEARRLEVWANADTPEQSTNARLRGSQGIGLCRTEHMFLGHERVAAVRKMVFADDEAQERAAYDVLAPLQRDDFVAILEAMDGLPVTIRLLDPPLHEFLPNHVELSVAVALAEARKKKKVEIDDEEMPLEEAQTILSKVQELEEANPMLGLRGVRLGIVKPGLYEMQVTAISEAAVELKKRGKNPHPEIMIPLVATAEELTRMRSILEPVVKNVIAEARVDLEIPFGTMIELPRAALRAEDIARDADFFSFGTNDLTQTAYGFSRDDIGKFLAMYEELKLVGWNPFVTIDEPGVGRLMEIAIEEGRRGNPNLHLGICGEHGGDPQSVRFCHGLGLDYVSCSPFRVPTARLAAGQAVLGEAQTSSK